ncbi:MAG TPA: DUF2170 family protein [Gammaproteobacteria bacterium]|nr:DUF2170 family protein [Gammaproteobacteria bacterium]
MNIKQIAKALEALNPEAREGFDFDYQMIPGEEDILQISLSGREEIPVYLTKTDTQLLCISYLWDETEIIPESRTQMIEMMLDMNIPMPLSSFSRIGDKYAVFGALSVDSSIEDIAHEIVILSDNAIDAIDVMSDFLK